MLLAFTAQQSGLDYPIPISPSAEFEIKMDQLMLAKGGYLYIKPLGNEQVSKRAKLKFSNPFDEITKLTYEKGIQYPIIYRKIPTDTLKSLPKIPGLITLNEVVIKGKGRGTVYRDKFMASLDSVAKFSGNYDYVGMCNWLNCISCGTGKRPAEGSTPNRYKDGRVPRHNVAFTAREVDKSPYTYPKYTDAELLEKFNIYRIKGYTAQKEFWEPNYKINPNELSASDFRNTLVWRHSIITNEKGEATVTFYCSDISGRFIGNIEGLDSTGLLGKTQFSFMVRDKKVNK